MYKLTKGANMEIKNILQKLNNQYFKSLRRMCKAFVDCSIFGEYKSKINSDYLKLISAVINNETNILSLTNNLVYIWSTINEKNELRILIDSVPTNY